MHQQQATMSVEDIVTSYEETMALATVTNSTSIGRVDKVQKDIQFLNKSLEEKLRDLVRAINTVNEETL